MKHGISIIVFCLILLLSACGSHTPAEEPSPAPTVPVNAEAPAATEPSAPPENIPAPTAEPTSTPSVPEISESPVIVNPPSPPQETPPAQPSASNDPQSASGKFTGVAGTEFLVPDGFIQLFESPNIGYQYTFWHPDYEIRIVVYEIAPGYIPEGAYETDYSIASRNPDVTYFNHGENWFVQSGYNNDGEEIFYSKESTTESGLKTFWITYPTAKREFGDPITAEFEKNCTF